MKQLGEKLIKKLHISLVKLGKKTPTQERKILGFFVVLFVIFSLRLAYLQIFEHAEYNNKLFAQHFNTKDLEPKRGNIYVLNSAGKPEALTQSISMYNVFVDPELLGNKDAVIEALSPIVYQHLCEGDALGKISPPECAQNVAEFVNESSTGFVAPEITTGTMMQFIKAGLSKKIVSGKREKNYVAYISSPVLLEQLKSSQFGFIDIVNDKYLYILPYQAQRNAGKLKELAQLLRDNGIEISDQEIERLKEPQNIRYVKLLDHVSPEIGKKFTDLKSEYEKKWYDEKKEVRKKYSALPRSERKNFSHDYQYGTDSHSLLHGLGLEEYPYRVYPRRTFASHILGYLDKNSVPFYGIEQYFDADLKGVPGKITGLSSDLIGNVGSNDIVIQNAQDGKDIYLTINPTYQEKVEKIIEYYYNEFRPDQVSVLVMNPRNGQIVVDANYPTFDPNHPTKDLLPVPVSGSLRKFIEDDTYMDIPILYQSGDQLVNATYDDRKNPELKKYMFRNILGPQVFVDRNIRYPYEPGSVFKALTLAIGVDSDSLGLYDSYVDNGRAEVQGFQDITNVDQKECIGNLRFINALEFSCNTGMIKIVQRIGRFVYYNYLDRVGIGKITGVELALEEPGYYRGLENFSYTNMYTNSFGQGELLVTPMQLGVIYSSLVNGGNIYKPTIVSKICDTKECIENTPELVSKIFSQKTSQDMLNALESVVVNGHSKVIFLKDYSLGGKTGTAQKTFKGKRMVGIGRTDATFVGMVTKKDPRFVIVVKFTRPRNNQYADSNAEVVFGEIARFLLEKEGIKG